MASINEEEYGCCSSCNRQTKYECINCSTAICNICNIFEHDEHVDGWQEMKSVGYCMDCKHFVRSSEPKTTPALPGTSAECSRTSNVKNYGSLSSTTWLAC